MCPKYLQTDKREVEPMILFNVGWMRKYRGQTRTDRIVGGGGHVVEHETAGEIYNFLPRNGRLRGYVTLPGESLNMRRLGTTMDAEYLDGVTVLFSASRPEPGCGSVIIGWYRNARVWRGYQPQHPFDYIAEARQHECTLVNEDERVFPVPRRSTHPKSPFVVGQKNVRYLDQSVAQGFVRDVRAYIDGPSRTPPGSARMFADPSLRKKVEITAVQCVVDHYEAMNFNCVSVEKENVGWDLECTRERLTLLVEVKGCSGKPDVQLTPNEYAAMLRCPHQYRLAIVSNALVDPHLDIVRYNVSDDTWRDMNERLASIDEKVAARVRLPI